MADEEDLFADLYEGDEEPKKPDLPVETPIKVEPALPAPVSSNEVKPEEQYNEPLKQEDFAAAFNSQGGVLDTAQHQYPAQQFGSQDFGNDETALNEHGFPATVGIKEDG
ncbi:MAG: hypothetical protein Q9162_004773 [Coniocarpon cinnabarinum]